MLGSTERTIKAHRQRVVEKLQVRTLAELASLAERVGVASAADNPVGRSMPRLAHVTIRMAASHARACGAGVHCQRRNISGHQRLRPSVMESQELASNIDPDRQARSFFFYQAPERVWIPD
jgi:hypothetical protein